MAYKKSSLYISITNLFIFKSFWIKPFIEKGCTKKKKQYYIYQSELLKLFYIITTHSCLRTRKIKMKKVNVVTNRKSFTDLQNLFDLRTDTPSREVDLPGRKRMMEQCQRKMNKESSSPTCTVREST